MDFQMKDILASIQHAQTLIGDLSKQLDQEKQSFDNVMDEYNLAARTLLHQYAFLTYQPPYQDMTYQADSADVMVTSLIARIKEELRCIQAHLNDIKAPLSRASNL